METIGSLLDKLSICKIKIEKLKESNNSMLPSVELQRDSLISEIDILLGNVVAGLVPIEEPKHKLYAHEKSSGEKFNGFAEAALKLFETNYTLWNLEDKRRDKTLSNEVVRVICDDIAKYNRLRNDTMDEINTILSQKIKRSTETQ
jgi:hypothetical protein